MAARHYYAMIGSLPHLPHFERADRLPINEQRLQWRWSMLDAEDQVQIRAATDLVKWHEHAATRTDEQVVRQYHRTCEAIRNPALREMIDYRMGLRSAVAALRRRYRGDPPPSLGEIWGAGLGAAQIPSRWEHPDFKLSALFPWLLEAKEMLEHGNALGLERLLADVLWIRLTGLAGQDPFSFEAVCSYIFRWHIVRRWLAHDAAAAQQRFQELVNEVTREHQEIFAK